MTKEISHKVHIAIARTQRDPKIDYPPIEVYRFTDEVLLTIADCFKFRNKIGKEIAFEVLRSGLEQKNIEVKEILKYAKICRVDNIMKPYLEAAINR